MQHPQNNSKIFDVPDRYSEQIRLHKNGTGRWKDLMKNITLIVFSCSELDSESDEGEDYMYEHKYETLI